MRDVRTKAVWGVLLFAGFLLSGCGALTDRAFKELGTRPIVKPLYREVEGGQEFTLGAPFNVVDRSIGFPAQPQWKAELGGAVFHAERDGNRLLVFAGSGLYALDAQNGKTLWKFSEAAGEVSRPLISGGTLFFSAYDADANDGKTKWGGISTVYALDLSSGKVLWTHKDSGGQFTDLSLSGDNLHVVFALPAADFPVASLLVTLNAQDGRLLWQVEPTKGAWLYADAVAAQGVVALAMNKQHVYEKLEKLESVVKTATDIYKTADFLYGDRNTLTFGDDEKTPRGWMYKIIAYSATTGEELWTREKGEKFVEMSTQVRRLQVTNSGLLYPDVGLSHTGPDADNRCAPFALDLRTGEVKWERVMMSTLDIHWPSESQLAGDRFVYGYGTSLAGLGTYLMCADLHNDGYVLWREVVKSNVGKQAMQDFDDAKAKAEAKSRARAAAERSLTGIGTATYRTYPYKYVIRGNASLLFTHRGIFAILPGDKKITRFIGGKEIWSFEHKVGEPVFADKVTRDYFLLGDEGGTVRFLDIETGKVKDKLAIGAKINQISVDGDRILVAADNALHAF